MDVWSPDHQADPLEKKKKIERRERGYKKPPAASGKVKGNLCFPPLTKLIMDVPNYPIIDK